MKKLISLFLLAALALPAQTSRENLQRTVNTNTITGSLSQQPFQVPLLAQLKAITVSSFMDTQVVIILGYTALGDGGAGQFTYNASSGTAPNDTTVVQPTVGAGRWLRISYFTTASPSTTGIIGTAGQVLANGTSGSSQTGSVTLTSPITLTGSASQVLVNGTSGTPTNGAMTLTLPQNIATASTPQFAKLGVNSAAAANSEIFITRAVPATTAQASVVVTGGLTAAYDLHPNAFRDTTTFTPTVAADAYTSYDAQATVGGTVALNHYHGYQARNGFTGSGTLGILSGFATTNMGLNGAGVITFMRGLYVSQPTITGAGSVGQFDGIYMDALTNSTGLVNAIYIAGANNVFMAGGQFGNSALLTYPAGAATSRGYFTFDQTSQTGLAIMNSNATATGVFVNFCNSGGTIQGSISQTNSTTVAYNVTSDFRLKENIRDMTDSGAVIDAIQPRMFDWKWGGNDYHGFIAQELYPVFPEAVTKGTEELDAKGDVVSPWQVDYTKLIPVLVAEIKNLRARLDALEAGQPKAKFISTKKSIPTDAAGLPINK